MINEDKTNLLKNTYLAFCFDFFSEFDRKKLAKYIMKASKLNDVSYSNDYRSPSTMTSSIRVCRNDYGGNKMTQVQINSMPYFEALNLAFKVFDVISMYGYTNSKCNVTVSVKMNTKELSLPRISDINTIKLLSSIDNCSQIKKKYTDSHEQMYLNSLMYIYPKDIMLAKDSACNGFVDFRHYSIPNNKKFTVVYDDLKADMVTVNFYIKKDYQNAKRTFYTFVGQLVSSINRILSNNESFNSDEMNKIERICTLQRGILSKIWDYSQLKTILPKIEILVDLKDDESLLKTYYATRIRQKLFELIAYCGLDSGTINYDTARNSIQVRDAHIINGNYISDIEFFYSYVSGDVKNCIFYECEIKNSILHDCEIMYGNTVSNSRIFNTSFHGICITIDNCFVLNPSDKIIEGDIKGSVIKGVLDFSSPMDEKSEVLK